MIIESVAVYELADVDVTPPPFRDIPSQVDVSLLRIDASDGISGWSVLGSPHHALAELVRSLGPALVGENPLTTGRIHAFIANRSLRKRFGRALVAAISAVDVALWDIKGKAFGQPVHHLLGGASDVVDVYVTFGAAAGTVYSGKQPYGLDELAQEAAHLVAAGHRRLKVPVGRLERPDPVDDHRRIAAIREAVGTDVTLAMDAASRFSLPQAHKLCALVEDLDIDFFEEPVSDNNPQLLAGLRAQTMVPIAAAATHRYSYLDLLRADAIDIVQPNALSDGGYTAALEIVALAKAFDRPIGHGNGTGPHNIALQAAVSDYGIVEYHYHWWMLYNAVFDGVPQPENDRLVVSHEPGLGLLPRPEVVERYAVSR